MTWTVILLWQQVVEMVSVGHRSTCVLAVDWLAFGAHILYGVWGSS